jgi:hypothetical protein
MFGVIPKIISVEYNVHSSGITHKGIKAENM